MKGSNNYATTQTAVELLGIANNGIAVAEDLNRQLQFFVVLAKNYLGGQDACLVFDRDGKLMKGTEKINSVDVNCKPIIVSLPNSNTYVVAMLNNNQQPVYHVVNMGLPGYGPIGNMGEVLSANNPLDGNSSITSKHGLHFTGSEDHINGHTMVFDTRYTADPAAAGQGTTDIMAYDFGSSTLTPVANKLYSSYGCGDTKQGQLQISPDGSQLAWWRYTNNLGGFDHRNAEIHTLPLNASKTALSGPVVTRSISAAGSYGNGALEFINNSSDLLYSQRGLYKENNNGTGPAYDRNVWKYSPVNLSSVRINPNTSSPMISYLFGEIKRGSDGNYYIPQMGKANDQIHAYNNANFNSDISLGDTMYKLTSSLPTQVYKVFEDPTASVKEFVRSVGNKAYELKDHLGNVRVVISDVKQFSMTGSTGNYYLDLQFFPEVKNYTDYYAGGAQMPGRQYNSTAYRYGFGSHEKVDEVSGNGNTVDMGDRWLDTRLVRTFKIDAKANNYAGISPYSYAANNPIIFIDPDGRDIILYNEKGEKAGKYTPGMEPTSSSKLVNETINALNTIHKVDNAGNGGPSPKEVVEFLASNHDIKLDITRVKLDGKSYTQDADKLGDTKFSYDGFDRDKSAVSWNPGIGAELLDKDGKPTGEKQSPATVLAHELKHAYNHHTLSKEDKSKLIATKDPAYVNASEKDATITTETDVAKANKEGTRTFRRNSAKGFFTKDRSSTTTEKATAKPIKP